MISKELHTYELWFLGDIVGKPQAKNRTTLNALLKEAHQMLTDAATVGGVVGEAEIVYRWAGQNEPKYETVWSMSLDEFKKGLRIIPFYSRKVED
jgi:hypothetical protein